MGQEEENQTEKKIIKTYHTEKYKEKVRKPGVDTETKEIKKEYVIGQDEGIQTEEKIIKKKYTEIFTEESKEKERKPGEIGRAHV